MSIEIVERRARFHVKRRKLRDEEGRPIPAVRQPWAVKDRQRPAFVRSYATFGAAMHAIDNIVRAEVGMPLRAYFTREDYERAIHEAKAFNNPGMHTHIFGDGGDDCPACEHRGQHVQGCRACDAASSTGFVIS